MMCFQQMMIEMLCAHFRGNCPENERIQIDLLPKAIEEAGQQKLLPLVVDSLCAIPEAMKLPDFAQYKRMARVQVMQQARRGIEFLEVYEKLKEAGVQALVVKGCVCRTVWPKGDLRVSADEDIYVRPADFEAACEALRGCGLSCDETADPATDFEIGWRRPNSTLYIELHQQLFSQESGAMGALQKYFEDAFDRAAKYTVEHGAGTVLSMSPEDHLLYLILHAYKHFIQSGFGIRQVCDVGLWARRYAADIDHDRLMRKLSDSHALHFAAAVFAIAKEDLGIDPELPFCWDAIEVDRAPMLADLLDGGVYGDSTMSRQHAAPMTLEAVAASRGNRKKKSLLRRAFPPKNALLRDYPELKEHAARLPFVWMKRLLKYRKEAKNDENNSVSESLRIAKEREELLRLYHII